MIFIISIKKRINRIYNMIRWKFRKKLSSSYIIENYVKIYYFINLINIYDIYFANCINFVIIIKIRPINLLQNWKIKDSYFFVFFFKGEFLLFDNLQLVAEVEFGCLLLELGEFVLIFGHLLECWFNAVKLL